MPCLLSGCVQYNRVADRNECCQEGITSRTESALSCGCTIIAVDAAETGDSKTSVAAADAIAATSTDPPAAVSACGSAATAGSPACSVQTACVI